MITGNTILFDLDGTLTDSAPGILNSFRYALRKMEAPPPREEDLRAVLGPPLRGSFMKYGYSAQDAERAVAFYREYFTDRGLFENNVYDGTVQMLARLRGMGKTLCVATSKPEIYTIRILKHFHLEEYFSVVAGSTLDGTRDRKDEVIRCVLERGGIEAREAVMVGDRVYDIEGAHALGMRAVGVLYGYGSRGELESAGADRLAASVPELSDFLAGEETA